MDSPILSLFPVCPGNLIDTNIKDERCERSVALYEVSDETRVTENINVKVTVDKVVLEGSGCYWLNSRDDRKGKSYVLGNDMIQRSQI